MTTLSETAPGTSLDMRVEDFLDDRLQSTADLDTLDELLASVETQRTQLQSQLDDAVRELDEARRTAQDRHLSLQARIDDFNQLQQSIDVRAKVAAASDAPSEAIARLKRPMKKLQTVDLAQKYLLLLQDVEALRAEARSHLPASPKAALKPYARLKELAMKLRAVQGSEGLHLVDHVERVTDVLWSEMKKTMSAELEAVLTKRQWPRVDPQSQMDDEWIACFEKLLDLQMPELVHSPGVVSLLPFDVMTKMFVTEFRFHFLSDKPTSNLQAVGSHCFPWFLATIDKWEAFFRDNLSHLLSAKFRDGPLDTKTAYLDPVCGFVTAMLPVMREKVQVVAAEAIKNPPYLSGFMSQLMALDDDIRARYSYDGGDPELGWPGLAADVLDTHFDDWFQVERDFALERFEKTLESQDARKIDYDYAVAGKMKPTFAAVRILDLLRAVTSKYERLHKLKHKLRFLTDIQLDILDGYHDRLRGSLEAYQSITSTLGRTLHGATREQLAALEGTGALETLCKVAGSADRVASTLSEWSDEEFFAALWEDIQARDARRRSSEVGRDGLQGRLPDTSAEGDEESGIFDETVAAYTMRRKAAEELLTGALTESHSKAFRAYLNQVQWTTVGETAVLDDPSQLSITPELDEPLHVLKRNLDFLYKTLSTASLRRVWHEALDRLQDMLWNGVLVRQSFTTLGAAQFAHDGAAILALVDRYLPGGSSALEALREGTRLLNLPASVGEGASGTTLKEASDRAFTSNDEARRVLEELGLEALTPVNARHILERRVENNENVGW
ncbi:RINT-1 / TIP-1 family protein [Hirsutella rhossiliensis]|uniref:RINT-1 / TIP-1 family domain-containing protein n=1 Tax=Hirsutella rhossiliensis TaxID=111463 RepID=A0A9P8MV27_9HYPO|nr:RINT-1 / TIP-1 family domain-containing protein [Hirsutella rhossiliensis]KAH0959727.1 RINT-1 / TIP-1 family domain-containing protein [Hirsutella rhossiliensis]